MSTLLAFPLASSLGGVEVSDIRSRPIGNKLWYIEWTPINVAWSESFVIALNGVHYQTITGQTNTVVRTPGSETPTIEIIQIDAVHGDPSFFPEAYFTTLEANKIKLTWNPPASVTDVESYRIFFDNATGTVQFTDAFLIGSDIIENGASSYEFLTKELVSGTYKFVIRTVDASGNESSNTTPTTVVLTAGYPGITTNVAISFSGGAVTLTWIDPSDIGSGTVKVFDNLGDATNQFVDYATVVSTIAAGVQTFTSAALADGTWLFGLRVNNGTNDELNTMVMASIRLDSGAAVGASPAAPKVTATTESAGKILLRADTQKSQGEAVVTKVQFFTNDGAGGAIDFGTPLSPGFIDTLRVGAGAFASLTTATFGETARKFSARAYTTAGVASPNAVEVTITPDATVPPQPLSVVGVEDR